MKLIAQEQNWNINSEPFVYACGKMRSHFHDLFGLGKISYKGTNFHNDYGAEYTHAGNKQDLIMAFYNRYSKEFVCKIVQEVIAENTEYEKSIIRFVGMKEAIRGVAIMPVYKEKDDIFESTLHINREGTQKQKSVEKILELFGFNPIISS